MNIFSSLSCSIKSPFSSKKDSTKSPSDSNGSSTGLKPSGASNGAIYDANENSSFDRSRDRTKSAFDSATSSTIGDSTKGPPSLAVDTPFSPPEPDPLPPIDLHDEVVEIMRKMIAQHDRMKARQAAFEAEELAAQQAASESRKAASSKKSIKDEVSAENAPSTKAIEELERVEKVETVAAAEPVSVTAEVEKSEEPKSEEAKTEEVKTEEVKTEEVKTEEVKTEEVKTEEVKTEEVKTEEAKTESDPAVKADEPKPDQSTAEEIKEKESAVDKVETDEAKSEEKPQGSEEESKEGESKEEETKEEKPAEGEISAEGAAPVEAEAEPEAEADAGAEEEEEEDGINLTRAEIETMFYFFANLMNTGDEKAQVDIAANVASRLLGVTDLDKSEDGGKNKLIDYLTSNFAKPPAPAVEEDEDLLDIESSSPGRTRSLSAGGELRKSRTEKIGNEADIMSDRAYEAMDLAGLSPEQIELMDPSKLGKWDFNIFNYCEKIATPLVQITEAVINQLQLVEKLELNRLKLKRFLGVVQDGYKDVPYHNHIHAADVTQTVYYMGTTGGVFGATQMPHMQRFALILGAAIHDIAHPGFTGKYQVASMSELALRYNDISPLENMHLATAFALWMKPQHNFTKQMQKPQFMELRRLVIDIVLGTDNDGHFELMGKLEALVQTAVQSAQQVGDVTASNIIAAAQEAGVATLRKTPVRRKSTPDEKEKEKEKEKEDADKRPSLVPIHAVSSKGGFSKVTMSSKVMPGHNHSHGSGQASHDHAPATIYSMSTKGGPRGMGMAVVKTVRVLEEEQTVKTSVKYTPAQQLLLLKSIIHAADVSNPTKPWEVYSQWTPRIMKEFYAEGDKLRAAKQPITFAFDRENPVPEPLFQMGFIRVIVSPLFTAISQLPGVNLTAVIDSMKNNVKKWEELDPSLIKPPPAPTPPPAPKTGSGKTLGEGAASPAPAAKPAPAPTPAAKPAEAARRNTRSSVVGTLAAQTIKEEDEEEED